MQVHYCRLTKDFSMLTIWGVWSLGMLIVSRVLTNPVEPADFMALSAEEFCSGQNNMRVNPKYIPELIDHLKTCLATSSGNSSRQEILASLFDSATPIVHKAFFDRKTGLKEVSSFTRIKNEFMKMTSDDVYNSDSQFLMRTPQNDNPMIYAPEDDQSSYVIEDEIRLCSEILNRDADMHNVLRLTQLPRVEKNSAHTITFPPLNITLGTSSEDVPYLILDMYVLATRCLSFTNMRSETLALVARHLIKMFREKIMPYVEPGEFEKAYSSIICVANHHHCVEPEVDDQGARESQRPKMPISFHLELLIPEVDNQDSRAELGSCVESDDSPHPSTRKTKCSSRKIQKETSGEPTVTMGWTLQGPYESMNGKLKPIQVIHEQGSIVKDFERFAIACHDKLTTVSFIVTAAVLGCLFTLAVVIMCLIRGHCGYVTLWPKGEDSYDAEANYNGPESKGENGPTFWQSPPNNRKESAMNDVDIEFQRVSPGSRKSKDRETYGEDNRHSYMAYHIPQSSFGAEAENESSNHESMYPADSGTRTKSSDESIITSLGDAEELAIPNDDSRIREPKWNDHSSRPCCDCPDSNQAEVLATLHKRCEFLSKRICDIVRQMSNDSVVEGSPSIESLKKFVRSVSREVVHDSDTISHLRSTPLDPLISEIESLVE